MHKCLIEPSKVCEKNGRAFLRSNHRNFGYWLLLARAQLSGPRLRARVGTWSSSSCYQRKQKFIFLADREKLWFVIRGGKVSRMQYWWNDLRARNPFQQRLSLIVRMNGGRSEASQHSEKPDAKNFLKKRALGQNWALGQTESFRNRSKETHCLVDFFTLDLKTSNI